MTTNRPLKVFLCHSKSDKEIVRDLYEKLRAEPWITPWLDEENLLPGQDWDMEIERAIKATDVIIVCLSNSSITKEGYVQKEIKTALDYSDYKPEGTVFIIPVRLENCTPPDRLSKWQYADYFEGQRERGMERLLSSLKKRADALPQNIKEEMITDLEGNQIEDLIWKAISLIRSNQRTNASFLQRNLRISYLNSLRLLDQLEEMGVVGPSKERDVLVGEDGSSDEDQYE